MTSILPIELEILHFNDVYNIQEREKSVEGGQDDIRAGAARFKRALDMYRSNEKLVLFSGDLFFPSVRKSYSNISTTNFLFALVSTHFDGEQMVYPFNKFNVDVSCIGNHEIDNGIEFAAKMMAKTSCPWILSNIVEKNKDNKPLCGVEPYHVLEH